MSNKILWKIYIIWFFRRIVPLMLIQVAGLIVILKLLANKVFFGRVIENASVAAGSNYWEFFKYLLSAFFEARVAVQFFILLILGIGALLLRDLGRITINYLKAFRK